MVFPLGSLLTALSRLGRMRIFYAKKIRSGGPQGSVLAPILHSLHINDTAAAPGTHLAFFADDSCIYAAEKRERRVLRKLNRGLTAVISWCERWNI
jgi:hypothetical protein